MPTPNGTESAQSLLGLDPIDLYFPCNKCSHEFLQHSVGTDGACDVQDTIVAWPKGGEPEIGPCDCEHFDGLMDDGMPRAARMRMPSNSEWSTMQADASLPAEVGQDAPPPSPEARERRLEWARAVVRATVTHVRRVVDGKSAWQPVRMVDTEADIDGPWDLTVEQLDRAGTGLVAAMALAIVRDFNDGGPFGGMMRNFLARRGGDVPRDGDGVQLQPARDGEEPAGHPGGADPSASVPV